MKFVLGAKTLSIVGATAFATLVATAAPATADPTPAPPAPAPSPVPEPAPTPAAEGSAQAITNSAAAPVVEGVPHLPSLDNLPPGTSDTPVTPNQPRLTYLRDLWHAMRTQEVSGGDALLLLTQRPMNADAPRGLPTGPQTPPPAAPMPEAPAPAPLPDAPAPAPAQAPAPSDAPPADAAQPAA